MFKLLTALTLSLSSLAAHATLVTSSLWDTRHPGLTGLAFKTDQFNGVELALTAFDFRSNTTLANNGTVFRAEAGSFGPQSLAKWGFGYLINTNNYCLSCLRVDMVWDYDPSADTDMRGYVRSVLNREVTSSFRNLEWQFIETEFGLWSPDQPGLYDLRLRVVDTDDIDATMAEVRIQVQIEAANAVTSPGTLALAGLALLAAGAVRRNRVSQTPAPLA